jgi:hypothetical protein
LNTEFLSGRLAAAASGGLPPVAAAANWRPVKQKLAAGGLILEILIFLSRNARKTFWFENFT